MHSTHLISSNIQKKKLVSYLFAFRLFGFEHVARSSFLTCKWFRSTESYKKSTEKLICAASIVYFQSDYIGAIPAFHFNVLINLNKRAVCFSVEVKNIIVFG